jgi:hypothetical protein
MLTANLLDAWLMNAIGGSIDLLIGVTSSIPCLLRVKGRKGGSNLMGANVARVHREPIPFPHRCGLLRPRGPHRRCLTGFKLY